MAQAALVRRYAALVHGVVLEIVRCPDAASGLTRLLFLELRTSRPEFGDGDCSGPWLARRAASLGNEHVGTTTRRGHRRRTVRAYMNDFFHPDSNGGNRLRGEGAVPESVWESLDTLSALCRRVFVLYHVEGCSCREIALFLGMSNEDVHAALFRSERQVRDGNSELAIDELAIDDRQHRRLRRRILIGLRIVAANQRWSRSNDGSD